MKNPDYWIRHDQAKTRGQLAQEYGISRKTFYNWLKESGICLSDRKLITPKEQEIIYEIFGQPKKIQRKW